MKNLNHTPQAHHMTLLNENLTLNIHITGQEHNLKHTCPMDRCPKKLPAPLQKLHA